VNTTGVQTQEKAAARSDTGRTVFAVLVAIGFSHFLNDMVQSLLPATYPLLKESFRLSFAQIGLITLTYQLAASLLQPLVGWYTDLRPQPYSLATGMAFTLTGLVGLSYAPSFSLLLLSAALVGVGSSVFHPESARVARMASGGQHGLAQSVFQVGGNFGSSLGPLLAAFIILPRGRRSISWFSSVALLAIVVLTGIGGWYKRRVALPAGSRKQAPKIVSVLPPRKATAVVAVLLALIFSKFFYLSSISSYFMFYLMITFKVSPRSAQLYLFAFLAAVTVGAMAGGPIGDRVGRKRVIWFSILGVFPFTFALPYASLAWTGVLIVIIGLVLASAFPAIIVYAQELLPGRVGMVSGVFYGLAFGLGGLGAALLGKLADVTSIGYVYRVCSFLPAIGLLTAFLPNLEPGVPGHFSRVRKAEGA
jgi:FSR family fosmidomycin resistance protein-like MFS transporter